MKATRDCERCGHPPRAAAFSATLEYRREGRRTKQERVRLCTQHYLTLLAGDGREGAPFVVRGRELKEGGR